MNSGLPAYLILVWLLNSACGSAPVSTLGAHENSAVSHAHSHAEPAASLFPFVDNYSAARDDAEQHRRPLFVLMTAKWCEPCAILHQKILTDPRLRSLLSQYTLLSSEVDHPSAVDAYRLFPVRVWPTVYIVNPFDETPVATQQGFAPVKEMDAFLKQGLGLFREFIADPGGDFAAVFSNIRKGRHFAAEGRFEPAVEAFEEALSSMPEDSPRRIETTALLVDSAAEAGLYAECIRSVTSLSPNTLPRATTLIRGAFCADSSDPNIKRQYREWVRPRLLTIVEKTESGATAAEKSSALAFLAADADQRRDAGAAGNYRIQHAALLKTIPLFSTDAEGISSLEMDRVRLYLYLNEAEALRTHLQNAANSNPQDWRPLYYLAWAELETGRYQAAAAAADRAYRLAEDPSRLEILWLLADIFSAESDRNRELDVLRTMAEYIEVLPQNLFSFKQLQHTSTRLKKLEALIGDEKKQQ